MRPPFYMEIFGKRETYGDSRLRGSARYLIYYSVVIETKNRKCPGFLHGRNNYECKYPLIKGLLDVSFR